MNYALKDSVGYRLNRCANTINQSLNKILHPYGIAIEQRATLEIIKFESEVNLTKIADLLGKDKTTISRTLNALEKKGLITKSPIAHDKRSKQIQLTQKGEDILEQTLQAMESFRQNLNNHLEKEEMTNFFNTLDTLSSSLQ